MIGSYSVPDELENTGDTWLWPAEDLQEIQLNIHLAPVVRHPDPAIRMILANLQPPTVWDNPNSPTVWDNARTVWDYFEPPRDA